MAPDWLPPAGKVSSSVAGNDGVAAAAMAVGSAAVAAWPPSGTPAAKKPMASSNSASP